MRMERQIIYHSIEDRAHFVWFNVFHDVRYEKTSYRDIRRRNLKFDFGHVLGVCVCVCVRAIQLLGASSRTRTRVSLGCECARWANQCAVLGPIPNNG